jgi:hypothetical protein
MARIIKYFYMRMNSIPQGERYSMKWERYSMKCIILLNTLENGPLKLNCTAFELIGAITSYFYDRFSMRLINIQRT